MKRVFTLFISLFILSSFSLVFSSNKEGSKITVRESIKEILNSVSEIIKCSIQAAEAELKELQKELKEKGDSIHKKAEISIVEKLQKILTELKKMEKALKEDLAKGEDLSKEKLKLYRKNLYNLEGKIDQFRKRIKKFAEEIEKECILLKEPIRKKVQDLLKEVERAINSMQERLKKHKKVDKSLSI